jgi:hypothetical protein
VGVARGNRWGSGGRRKRGRLGIKRGGVFRKYWDSVELEGRERRRGNWSVTHVFETFLGEDGVQQAGDGCVVWHSVYFAEARQGGLGEGGGWCDFAISKSEGTRISETANLEWAWNERSIREVGELEFFCVEAKWYHRAA